MMAADCERWASSEPDPEKAAKLAGLGRLHRLLAAYSVDGRSKPRRPRANRA